MHELISIEEKLPKEFEHVLVMRHPGGEMPYLESGYYVEPEHYKGGGIASPGRWVTRMGIEIERWNDISGHFDGKLREVPPVTHWMPLPTLATAEVSS